MIESYFSSSERTNYMGSYLYVPQLDFFNRFFQKKFG